MNIMNKFKYIFVLMVGVLMFTSCAEEDSFISSVEEGDNLTVFMNNSKSVLQEATGDEYTVELSMRVTGPSVDALSGDVTTTVQPVFDGIPEEARAEEGTHFRIDNNELTLTSENNYEGTFNLTMLTDGISPPLDNSPQLKLKTTDVSGGGVILSGKEPIDVTLGYACASELEGLYDVSVNAGAASFEDIEVVKTAIGEYDTNVLGVFGPANTPPNNFERGIIINDVCGEISVPNQTLAQFSNAVSGVATHDVVGDPEVEGGVTSFTAEYEIEGYGNQTVEFTYQGPLPE